MSFRVRYRPSLHTTLNRVLRPEVWDRPLHAVISPLLQIRILIACCLSFGGPYLNFNSGDSSLQF